MRISRMHPAVQRGRLAGLRRHDAAQARAIRAKQAQARLDAKAKAEAKQALTYYGVRTYVGGGSLRSYNSFDSKGLQLL